MKPTKFYGMNEREAFLKVKQALGEEAIILETKHVSKGGLMGFSGNSVVEITATTNPVKSLLKEMNPVEAPPQSKFLAKTYQNNSQLINQSIPTSVKRKADELREALSNSTSNETTKIISNNQALELFKDKEKLEKEVNQIKNMVQELITQTQSEKIASFPQELVELYQLLINNDISKELALGMVNKMRKDLVNTTLTQELINKTLNQYLGRLIPRHGPLQLSENKTSYVAMIGATGVGKTTTIAKLAAIHKFQFNKKVGFITLDTYRIGAVDQLRKYAEIMDAPLEVVHAPEDFKGAIEKLKDRDLVLIDTAGRNQKSEAKRQELENYFRYTPIEEIYLVLSATSNEKNIMSNIKEFSSFPISSLIITKIDEAVSYGPILSIVAKANRSVAYFTTGQEVPQDIEVSDSSKLTDLILGQVTYDV
ncbi:MAG: flagellar biosynthesis protein FlhF [Planctomycetota bacterium]|nr:MAG: flagellar biosynthesis protein FlhF [Planctomycetota bacterium]